MRLPNCGKNRDDSVDIPSMCEDKGRRKRQIEEFEESEFVVEETEVIDEIELETDDEYLDIEDDGINVGPPVNTRTGDARRIIGGRSAHPGKSPWQVWSLVVLLIITLGGERVQRSQNSADHTGDRTFECGW